MESARSFFVRIALVCVTLTGTAHAASYDPAAVPPGPVAAVTLSGSALAQDATLYQPWFDAANWSGDLLAFAVNPANGQTGAQRWSAAQQLTARDWRERVVVTRRDDTGQAVSLRRLGDLSTAQQAALGDQATLDYLRGDPAQEGGRFRARRYLDNQGQLERNILGPIIHADPLFIGAGEAARIYAAANDGMLHVFSADDGRELYAYVPGMIYRQLATLADDSGDTPPPYTVDGGITVAPVRFRDGSIHTVLVGSLGAGGQGLYALDVSKVATDEASALQSVLWEVTDSNDAALGYVPGVLQIVQLNDGHWVVLVGNGYANTLDDGHSGSGTAALLIVDIENGNVLRRIDTYAGDSADPNGLGPPRSIDTDADGRTDYVYAGDLRGNLWRFDLRAANSGDWRVSFNTAPLYSARDADGHSQSITVAPAIIAHPQQGVRVLFGTGRLLSRDDLDPVAGAQNNALYGVRDRLDATATDPANTAHYALVEQTYANTVRVLTVNAETPTSDPDVWRVDLPAGARVVTEPVIENGRLISTVMQPLVGTGEVWLATLDAQSGAAPLEVSFDMNGDGVMDPRDDVHPIHGEITAVTGLYYGSGLGSEPVSGNLSASRRVTYINRIAAGARPGKPISTGDADTTLDTVDSTVTDTDTNLPSDADTTLTQDPLHLIDTAPPCGIDGCVAEARRNPGRVAWKELIAE